ncbi:unnamed protein product [Didymodactylos carnosus]|uniref:Uncharacterized protein n=1 Tax=Didymodactylos carnosus TaxID=1234261 RepID=A0A813ZBK7_9BILA|nr:unnamed protein product [Didymodactylos carnosus]CAF3679612.1 unnamed protein product [Didymodactylos carnosus]
MCTSPSDCKTIPWLFFRRRCKKFIATQQEPSRCYCGRTEEEHFDKANSPLRIPAKAIKSIQPKSNYNNLYINSHDQDEHDLEKWNVSRHTTLYPTNAFGTIEFEGTTHLAKAEYIRLAYDTNPSQIVHLFNKYWRLQLPNLIVSIHGGIQNFDLQPRLRQVLKTGLLKAANTTGAWILTNGTNTGTVRHVGDALFVKSRTRSKIVVIGIAPWGVVEGREQLKGENKTVSYHCSAAVTGENNATLNSSHSCFLLVDNGTVGKYGGEIVLRKRLEKYLSQQKIAFHGHSSKQNIPVVCVIVEGGTNTIRTVLEYVTEEPPVPVVVCDGSGRAADLISFTYRHAEADGTMSVDLQDQLLRVIMKVFSYNRRQAENVYVELMLCMRKKEYITIFRIDDDDSAGQEIDQAILRTLLRNHKASALEQFRLILSWNRPDIAQTCLLTKRNEWVQENLETAMFEALSEDKVEYVKLLLENGVSMQKFLTFDRLQALYNNKCGTTTNTLDLIIKDLRRHHGRKTYSLFDIGLVIEKLMGQGYRSAYTRRTFRHLCARQASRYRQNHDTNLDIDSKQNPQTSTSNIIPRSDDIPMTSTKKVACDNPTFDSPYNDLLIWAVLNKRHSMALFCWENGEDGLAKALMACRLNKSLAREAEDDELDTEIAEEFLLHAEDFQQRALALLDQCYKENTDKAGQLLTYELYDKNFSDLNCLDLAVLAYSRDFVAHKSCQQLLSDLWIGGMNVRKYLKWMVLLALFCPLFIFLIDFKSPRELEKMPQTEEEAYLEEQNEMSDSDDSVSDDSDDSENSDLHELHESTIDDDEHSADDDRKKKRKKKKKRRKRNSNSIHNDEHSASKTEDVTLLVAGQKNEANIITDIITTTITEPTGATMITVDDNKIGSSKSKNRRCLNLIQNWINQSIFYRFFRLLYNRFQKLFKRYGCWRKIRTINTLRYTNSIGDAQPCVLYEMNEKQNNLLINNADLPIMKKIYEFYNAPVTKFFQDLIFFLLFLAHFTYVILIRTPPKPSVVEWLIMCYLSTMALDQIREILTMNATPWRIRLRVYFIDYLHLYDTFGILIFALAFSLRLTVDLRVIGRLLLCVNLSYWYLRMFHFLVVSKEVGPYIHIAARNIIDLLRLIVIVIIVLMSFGVSRQAIKYPNEGFTWHLVKEIFLEPYFMIYGEVYADKIDAPCNRTDDPSNPSCMPGHWITPITMTVFLLVCNILLLSMLMAKFNATFLRLSRLSDQVWKFQRYHTVMQYESKPKLAPPIIIFSHIYLLVETLYQLFLNADDIEKLRDFEEECVHEYLTLKEEREKGTVEEKMSFTIDKVSNMLTRVDTIKQSETQQTSYLQSFDERLQRLEDIHTSTLTLLQTLIQNLNQNQRPLSPTTPTRILQSPSLQSIYPEQSAIDDLKFEPASSSVSLNNNQTTSEEKAQALSRHHAAQGRSFSLAPRLDPETQTDLLAASSSCNLFNKNASIAYSPPTPAVITTTQHDEIISIVRNPLFLSMDKTVLMVQHSSSHQDEQNPQDEKLYEAEETEHNIIGKLIKERVRTLSTAVEEIERTLERVPRRNNDEITETSSNNTEDYLGEEELLPSIIDWNKAASGMVTPSQSEIQHHHQGDDLFNPTSNNNGEYILQMDELNSVHSAVEVTSLSTSLTQQQDNP